MKSVTEQALLEGIFSQVKSSISNGFDCKKVLDDLMGTFNAVRDLGVKLNVEGLKEYPVMVKRGTKKCAKK